MLHSKKWSFFCVLQRKKREKLHLEIALQDSTRHFHYHANLLANTCKIFGKRKKFAFCISTYLRGSSANSYSQTQNIASKRKKKNEKNQSMGLFVQTYFRLEILFWYASDLTNFWDLLYLCPTTTYLGKVFNIPSRENNWNKN